MKHKKHRKNFPTSPKPKKGTCRICGCTDERACYLPGENGTCSWVDGTKTLCNSPYCVNKNAETIKEFNLGDSLRHTAIWNHQKQIEFFENRISRSKMMSANGPRSIAFRRMVRLEIVKEKKEIKRLQHLKPSAVIQLYHDHQKAIC
jgi:hypothetical protein